MKDKYMHASVCAFISLCTVVLFFFLHTTVLSANIAGFCTAMSAGLAKEYGDSCSPVNKWDWQDVLADTLGAFGGMLLGTLIYLCR